MAATVLVAVAVPVALVSSGGGKETHIVTEPDTDVHSSASTIAATLPSPVTTIASYPSGTWRLLPADPRGTTFDAEVVWTGREAIAFGGRDESNQLQSDNAAFDPARNVWRRVAPAPDGGKRIDPLVAWTGNVVLVIGGENPDGSLLVSGASSYDPVRDSWQGRASPPIGFVTSRSPWVWTGNTLLVWPGDGGGSSMTISPMEYDPIADVWNVLPDPPVERRQDAASAWTGREWIVWGGRNGDTDLSDGAAFNPTSATWRVLAPSPLTPRRTRSVWTGSEMIVAAGASGPDLTPLALSDGAAYQPSTDTWRPIASGPAHPGLTPVWTGTMLVAFFKNYEFTYDPSADRWIEGPRNDHAGSSPTPLWTGTEALILGGPNGAGGAAYTPPP